MSANRPLAAAVCAVLCLAGCGGSSQSSNKAGSGKSSRTSLLGSAQSAGTATSYKPTGQIVADSGFRPNVDGFAFENYGNDAGPANLTSAQVADMFGAQVCATGSGSSCRLIPTAQRWMDQVNVSMANGHCMGFSVTAMRFFSKNLAPSGYGASRTFDIPVQGNVPIQSLIAEDFAYQGLPSVTGAAVKGTPKQVLDALVAALKSKKEGYTLAIFKADGTGGHAITPFQVEDRGGGRFAILVYDNNFPGIVRAVQVDTNANAWQYVGGINPSDTSEIYQGDASSRSMYLLPTTPGEGTQACPFCSTGGPGAKPSVIDKLHYIEVAITAKGAAHPHLEFIDPQGRRTGYVNGKLVSEIPGVEVIQNLSIQNWKTAPEPTYHLPLGHPAYKVIVDGSNVSSAITTQLQINGAGLVFYVQNIKVAPGQQDTMLLPPKDLSISYASGSKFPGSPTIGVQFPQFLLHSKRARLITMVTGSIGYAPGSPVTLILRPIDGTAYLASVGATPLVPQARFVLSVDSSPVNGGPPERYYLTQSVKLESSKEQLAHFQYLHPTTTTLPIDIVQSGRVVGREFAPMAH
jgi:hypothetical protein